MELIHTTGRLPMYKSGGVYLLRSSQLTPEDSALLASRGRDLSPWRSRARWRAKWRRRPRRVMPSRRCCRPTRASDVRSRPRSTTRCSMTMANRCEFAGHFGGFDAKRRLRHPPARPASRRRCPGRMSIANPRFGFLVTESGGGYTWAGNSRENKLTSWSNDPITDPPSEIIYLRDEETGDILDADAAARCATMPSIASNMVVATRGSVITSHGIESELLLSIAPNACVKFACLKLKQLSDRAADALGDVLRRVGARRQSPDDANARPHLARRGDRCARWPITATTKTSRNKSPSCTCWAAPIR